MSKQLDVLFVSPNNSEQFQELKDKYSAIEPPFWSLLLAGSCRKRGFGVAILDCNAEHLSVEQTIEKIHHLNPRLVCWVVFASNPNGGTTNMQGVLNVGPILKDTYPQYKTCVIGSYASALPQECIKFNFVDFVALNEGVKCLHQLLATDLETDLHTVPALWWKQYGLVQINDATNSLVKQDEMDEYLPGYPWELLPYKEKPLDLYRSHFWLTSYNHDLRTPYAAIYTSLGCQFSCNFCMINILNRTSNNLQTHAADSNFMRFWSTEKVLSWIEELIEKYGCTTLRFVDELFLFQKNRYKPILEGIIERGYGDKITNWCYSRIDTIRSEMLDLCVKSGIKYLGVGIESSSQEIRKEITKGKFKNINIRDIIKEAETSGINIGQNFIFGLPSENYEHMQASLNLAMELNTDFANFYGAVCIPGSPLYFEAQKNNWYIPTKFSEYGFLSYDHVPLPTKYLTSAEVLKFRDNAWHKYFENPVYLNKIESKYGKTIRSNIEEQTKIKLKRKILGD